MKFALRTVIHLFFFSGIPCILVYGIYRLHICNILCIDFDFLLANYKFNSLAYTHTYTHAHIELKPEFLVASIDMSWKLPQVL